MIWWSLVLLVVLAFGLGALLGAPFVPLLRRDVETALDLGNVKAGSRVLDLGSGDGRLLLAVAKRGGMATGYEINPVLWLWSWLRLWPYRHRVKVHLGNYWRASWPEVDVIIIFGLRRLMPRLAQELRRRSTSGQLVSYVFQLPGQQPVRQTANTYVYRLPLAR